MGTAKSTLIYFSLFITVPLNLLLGFIEFFITLVISSWDIVLIIALAGVLIIPTILVQLGLFLVVFFFPEPFIIGVAVYYDFIRIILNTFFVIIPNAIIPLLPLIADGWNSFVCSVIAFIQTFLMSLCPGNWPPNDVLVDCPVLQKFLTALWLILQLIWTTLQVLFTVLIELLDTMGAFLCDPTMIILNCADFCTNASCTGGDDISFVTLTTDRLALYGVVIGFIIDVVSFALETIFPVFLLFFAFIADINLFFFKLFLAIIISTSSFMVVFFNRLIRVIFMIPTPEPVDNGQINPASITFVGNFITSTLSTFTEAAPGPIEIKSVLLDILNFLGTAVDVVLFIIRTVVLLLDKVLCMIVHPQCLFQSICDFIESVLDDGSGGIIFVGINIGIIQIDFAPLLISICNDIATSLSFGASCPCNFCVVEPGTVLGFFSPSGVPCNPNFPISTIPSIPSGCCINTSVYFSILNILGFAL
jgi:hypothetical protein